MLLQPGQIEIVGHIHVSKTQCSTCFYTQPLQNPKQDAYMLVLQRGGQRVITCKNCFDKHYEQELGN